LWHLPRYRHRFVFDCFVVLNGFFNAFGVIWQKMLRNFATDEGRSVREVSGLLAKSI